MSQIPPDKVALEGDVAGNNQSKDDKETRNKSKEEKPEPVEDVDLLVYNVDWQQAKCVVGLT